MALLIRELSLPFACVMLIFSWKEKRHTETIAWSTGIAVFLIALLLHAHVVSKLIMPGDYAFEAGWIVFGGWPFVLNTAQMHPAFLALPSPFIAVIVPFALMGLAWWRDNVGTRAAAIVGVYMFAFFFVGRRPNIYWGFMYAFIMPLGLLYVPAVIKGMWDTVRPPPKVSP